MIKVFSKKEILTLKDGVNLCSKLWMPEGGGQWPALLMRQPYGLDIASTITYAHPAWWASKGFLVVIQDVRGQGQSEGEFQGFDQESADTSQTQDWVRSLKECNGLLGTYGFSYQGLTQVLGDKNSKSPDCMAPAMMGLDECAHWSCDGGAFWWHIGIGWGLQLAALKLKREGRVEAWMKIRASLENGTYLKDGYYLLQKYDSQGLAFKWLLNSHLQKEGKTHTPLNTCLTKPMLLIGGWWDPHLLGVIDLYKRSKRAGGKPELHIGPGTHLKWWKSAQELQLKFFQKHLKLENKNKSNNSIFLWNITQKKWDSNPSSTSIENWSLRSTGLACLDIEDGVMTKDKKGFGRIYIVHDPWRPVPAIGGHLSPNPGLAIRTEIDERTDVATFTSGKAKKDFSLNGIPILSFSVEVDKPTFDICIGLSIIHKNSREANQISTGFLRVRENTEKVKTKLKVSLQPTYAHISKGDRLRISISGSSWPAIGINPGTLTKPCGATGPHCEVITIAIDLESSNFQFSELI